MTRPTVHLGCQQGETAIATVTAATRFASDARPRPRPRSDSPANPPRLNLRTLRDLELEDIAVVHRAVAVGYLVKRSDPVEDGGGLDPAFQHVREQLVD
jgi:hypothetical protein